MIWNIPGNDSTMSWNNEQSRVCVCSLSELSGLTQFVLNETAQREETETTCVFVSWLIDWLSSPPAFYLTLSLIPLSHPSLLPLSAPPHVAAVLTESWSLRGETRCWSEWAAAASRVWPAWLPSSPIWRFPRSPWGKATASLTSRFELNFTAKKHPSEQLSVSLRNEHVYSFMKDGIMSCQRNRCTNKCSHPLFVV